jgi:hydrogenase/urease accessory protein HupE
MKGYFIRLFTPFAALAVLAASASAHPGHAPTDLVAELSAPLAGADHLMVTVTVSVLAALVLARLVTHLVERRRAARR